MGYAVIIVLASHVERVGVFVSRPIGVRARGARPVGAVWRAGWLDVMAAGSPHPLDGIADGDFE